MNDDIEFMRDDKGRESAGNVKSIRLWDKSMDDHEVAGECGCLLPVVSEIKCEKTIVLSPTYKQVPRPPARRIGRQLAR